jgi:hypothetical protein
MAAYTCPNPSCGVTLKTANKVAPGKKVKCPKCNEAFVAEPEEAAPPAAGPGTFKFVDGDSGKKPSPPPPPPPVSRFHEDEEDAESVKKGYGVVKETEEEIKKAEKNKPKFTEVSDKHKKSARGPAMGLLVMPANLLTAEGLLTTAAGLFVFVWGLWPMVFNEGALGDEEIEEAIIKMILGLVTFGWGAMICYGASQMQELASYTMAMGGAVLGVLPLFVGIYAIIMLQNPKVKAGFEESEGGPDDDDEDEKDDDEDEDDDDEDEEDEEDEDDDDDDD